MTFDGGAQAAAGLREGEVLAGKYRVERVLGAGGMGVVVAAQHLQLGTKVAVKFLLPAMQQDPKIVQRFVEEARRAAQITSEHVVRVFDVGVLESGAPYMVMEFLQGADLSAYLRQRGPLPVEDAVDFVLQSMEAIAEAHTHAQVIVHRDLKPANLFCVRRPDGLLSIKVLDFGISKATGSGGASGRLAMTETAAAMGSPFYMSPEQMGDSSSVDIRTDIWALGVILFELVAGKVPFYAQSVPEVVLKVSGHAAPRLRDLRDDVPEGLERVVLKCLEKDRERRYRNVAELAAALLPFAPKRATASVERIAGTVQAAGLSASALWVSSSDQRMDQPAPTETIAPLGRTAPSGKGSKLFMGLFTGVGLAVLAGGAAALHRVWVRPIAGGSGAAELPPSLRSPPAEEVGVAPPKPKEPGGPETCQPDSKRCIGSTPQTCANGRWMSAPVTAGQCGASCTPASAPERCKGSRPQSCSPSGEWIDGLPCARHQFCREGVCVEVGASAPPLPKHDAGNGSSGAAAASAPAATATAVAPKPDCDPNFTLDAQGRKHFKPECFAK